MRISGFSKTRTIFWNHRRTDEGKLVVRFDCFTFKTKTEALKDNAMVLTFLTFIKRRFLKK